MWPGQCPLSSKEGFPPQALLRSPTHFHKLGHESDLFRSPLGGDRIRRPQATVHIPGGEEKEEAACGEAGTSSSDGFWSPGTVPSVALTPWILKRPVLLLRTYRTRLGSHPWHSDCWGHQKEEVGPARVPTVSREPCLLRISGNKMELSKV